MKKAKKEAAVNDDGTLKAAPRQIETDTKEGGYLREKKNHEMSEKKEHDAI